MNNKIKTIVAFIFGFGIGSAISYELVKKKFADRLDEEIVVIKNYYKDQDKKLKSELMQNKPAIDSVVDTVIAEKNNNVVSDALKFNAKEKKEYKNYAGCYQSSDEKLEQQEVVPKPKKNPYVIKPEEFGNAGYSEISLTYYSDGILTEESYSDKLSITKILGSGNIKRIGEYAQDTLYIRDEEKKIDYEVLKDTHTYAELYEEYEEA